MASIGRASAFLASGTIVSRLLGFVRIIVLAQTLGVTGSASADAFAIANQLPNNVYVIIGGGVLSAVLVPQIVRASLHHDGGKAYINKLLTLTLVVIGSATLLATLLAPLLVFAYGPKLTGEQQALATAFAFWCMPQIFFYGLYTVLGEILNAKKVFGPFTWAPVVNNIVSIIGLVLLVVMFGNPGDGGRPVEEWTPAMIAVLAGSATLGVAAQALILLVFWRRVGLSYRPDFTWRGVGLGATGRIASWTFGMLILTQLAGVVESAVSSSAIGKGPSVLALQVAWLVFMLPHSVITVSIATAFFTRMAEHGQTGEISRLKADISSAIRVITLLIALAAVVLLVTAFPFARFFTSNFTDTMAVGWVIIGFMIGLVPFCILFVLQRAFYALGDTKTPFFFTLFQVILFTAGTLGVGLALPVQQIGVGIAIVMSLAGTAQTLLAGFLLRRRLGGLELDVLIPSLVRFTVAAIPAGVAGWFTLVALGGVREGGFAISSIPGAIVSMAVVGAVVAALYLATLAILRTPELKAALTPVLARFKR